MIISCVDGEQYFAVEGGWIVFIDRLDGGDGYTRVMELGDRGATDLRLENWRFIVFIQNDDPGVADLFQIFQIPEWTTTKMLT